MTFYVRDAARSNAVGVDSLRRATPKDITDEHVKLAADAIAGVSFCASAEDYNSGAWVEQAAREALAAALSVGAPA